MIKEMASATDIVRLLKRSLGLGALISLDLC